MDKNNKIGKLFLIVAIIIFVGSIYISLDGFHNNRLDGVQWFILLGTLFTSTVNFFENRKEKKVYYSIGSLIIALTVLSCYVAPQILMYR